MRLRTHDPTALAAEVEQGDTARPAITAGSSTDPPGADVRALATATDT